LFVVIIIAGNVLGWFYAAPPVRLSYRGLGEISTAVIASLLPILGYLTMEGSLKPDALLLIPPSFLCGMAFILTVEIPDEDPDRLGYKRTWMVRYGGTFVFAAIAACFFFTTIYFFFIKSLYPYPLPVNSYILSIISLIPLSASLYGAVSKHRDVLEKTKVVNLIIVSLAVFLLLVNGYIFLLAIAN
jgi:1,4-dihydroxy-2-naphthoate octaprenyltransferase